MPLKKRQKGQRTKSGGVRNEVVSGSTTDDEPHVISGFCWESIFFPRLIRSPQKLSSFRNPDRISHALN
ncbi:hypothetical protein NECAME_03703 [Necator americanus]|uniref:Uncharacterized protein n=1 Tax=Necator americanus TaxID=51031 RepID=W2T3C4_NECAM|nr:hypothetical protein NECAME_03703 [Necator americanus]ETN75731.1 hypothetical protein NECAME_03703 [Necator americanus]